MAFKKLVRFQENDSTYYGDLQDTDGKSFTVLKLTGNLYEGLVRSDAVVKTTKLLCPLERTPMIQCIGVNYREHAKEANINVPTYPVVFTKPADALSGPNDEILVHLDAQEKLDYEGELCVIIGKDTKNASESNALQNVLGYAIGNDVSARNFQLPNAGGGQYSYAKSFDTFAPIGPAIWSPDLIPDPQSLTFRTKVNGEVVQETSTSDMIWSVRQIIAHLSRGTTLRAGTVIMTGTPSGVGYFRNKFLEDGDEVCVEVEGLGGICNRVKFER